MKKTRAFSAQTVMFFLGTKNAFPKSFLLFCLILIFFFAETVTKGVSATVKYMFCDFSYYPRMECQTKLKFSIVKWDCNHNKYPWCALLLKLAWASFLLGIPLCTCRKCDLREPPATRIICDVGVSTPPSCFCRGFPGKKVSLDVTTSS